MRPLRIRGRHENARTTRSRSAAIAARTGTLPARCTLAGSLTVRCAITSYGADRVKTPPSLEQATKVKAFMPPMNPSDVRGSRPTQRGLEAAVGQAKQRDGE
ncbi:hypothetical protein [Burkholderia multivorans]|uniref:hypothetical protein n=1 Tax=Burkholderia multivorans TaxID=87883 RepID=UPI0020A216C2|nr:hypothetical protein [Burkholderia multivorans]